MNEVWRRTVDLIRCYPVLWLPIVWAASLGYGWEQLRLIILYDALPHILYRQSLLGGAVPDKSPGRIAVLYLMSITNTVVLEYTDICGYAVALLITAKMLGRLTADDPNNMPYANVSVASRWRGVLWLGLLAYAVAFGSGLIFIPVGYYFGLAHHLSLLKEPYVIAVVGFTMYALLAYVLSPVALRLLSQSERGGVGAREIAIARKCWLIAGGAITALSWIQSLTPRPFDPNLTDRAFLGLFWTILGSLPYTPLFIAMSLLGAGFLKTACAPEDVSGALTYEANSMQSE